MCSTRAATTISGSGGPASRRRLWSLIIYYIAINKRLPAHKVDEYLLEIEKLPLCATVIAPTLIRSDAVYGLTPGRKPPLPKQPVVP